MRTLLPLLGSVLASGGGTLAAPYKLTFSVTDRCNARCVTCSAGRRAPRPELAAAECRALFRSLPALRWLDLTGGEPTLREDLVEIAAGAMQECRGLALLHFPTNGLVPERVAAATQGLLRLRPPRLVVTVSLDGPPALHDELRGMAGAFSRAVESFERLRGLRGVRVLFGVTLSPRVLGRFRETVEEVGRRLPGVGPRDFHVNLMHRSPHVYGDAPEPLPDPAAAARELAAVGRLQAGGWGPLALLERGYRSYAPDYLATGRSPLPCVALAATCFLAPDGTLYPCTAWDRPLGSLRGAGGALPPLWRGEPAAAARREIAAGRCPGCWSPCDAFPALAASPRRVAVRLVRDRFSPRGRHGTCEA